MRLFKKNHFIIPTLFLLVIIITYWGSFIDKIGLHGDEAWLGLEGINILKNGIVRPYGMNKYTGILQSFLNSILFKSFGIGIIQLRIGGIALNCISLLLCTWFIQKKLNWIAAFTFLILFAQSTLYLCYGKIAWEVCSFTLIFNATSIISLYYASTQKGKLKYITSFSFLLSTFLGSYIISYFLAYHFLCYLE